MNIQAFPSGPFSTNSYLIVCLATKEAAIIDAAPDSAQAICAYLDKHGLTCNQLLLTHSHWDHIADVALLKEQLHVQVWVHSLDIPNLEHPGADQLPCWISFPGVHPDHLFEEGESIEVGQLRFSVIHTPGHSPGSSCFYEKQQGVLFSGDTLFKGTIGNLSFPTSQPELMWSSLSKLNQLPPQTKVYPGHGESTTIGAEAWLSHAKEMFEI